MVNPSYPGGKEPRRELVEVASLYGKEKYNALAEADNDNASQTSNLTTKRERDLAITKFTEHVSIRRQ
jgi:hypothetical protein